MVALTVGVVAVLAFWNGANDNFKGVATLYGSGTTSYGAALAWATVTTLAGSLLAPVLAAGLIRTFSAKGLVPDATALAPAFLASAALAAALTVLAATRAGLPVSTTHALIGGLVGAGLVSGPVNLTVLGGSFLLPLAVSPFFAAVLAAVGYPAARAVRERLGIVGESCVCVGSEWLPAGMMVAAERVTVSTGTREVCVRRYSGSLLGVSAQELVDGAHVVAAGAVGFARGLNDTPKLAALILAVEGAGGTISGVGGVALAMAVGGILGARRVAETMARKITPLGPGQGVVASVGTAAMVIGASVWTLPISTTHVATGHIFGIGIANRSVSVRMLGGIVAAWLITLPLAAAIGAVAFAVMR